MIDLSSFQSKAAANLIQIVFFIAINLCSFVLIGSNLRKYVGVLKTVPDNMNRSMVLRYLNNRFYKRTISLFCPPQIKNIYLIDIKE